MLVTNGVITRNIAGAKLPEYAAKGYVEVKAQGETPAPVPPAKPKQPKKAKE